ncbi:FliI/YscN family ATPase [Psychromonas sp. Urea-02u-13]|uniref:FliI/YscN family ATPase n=1 Tax=Psychromonas sp. Urea-02u-13 TaxID=2058326 RepID=UPI000C33F772|nr:FliI/YscN family ATPase [Psychromonas sp. Urea-02u-13]PKG39542.1 flagellum-specific ATP synthase FliI [Psychromonas sp. Urea-02u-13]
MIPLISVKNVKDISIATLTGKVINANNQLIIAEGCLFRLNQDCIVETDKEEIKAKVIGIDRAKAYLMPYSPFSTIYVGSKVIPLNNTEHYYIDDSWLGRILDARGEAIDDKPTPTGKDKITLRSAEKINILKKKPITEKFDVGVRAINALLTLAKGQRIGLVAGSGVGKSVLMGMITQFSEADIIVVGLIGERNREVREFIERNIGEDGMQKSVVIAAPADQSPLMRIQATELCHSVAEYYRDKGKNVLLLVDSLTRYAMAQREVAIAMGEPPAIKGYPPSVFSFIPPLLERSGNGGENSGSMTAIYTILSEGDEDYDPVVDTAKAILDGHIVLSKELAQRGHFPAIDIEKSISRCMDSIVLDSHSQIARQCKRLYSMYHQAKDLISLGGYQAGNDPELDEAIQKHSGIESILMQSTTQHVNFESSCQQLARIFK